MHDPIWPFSSYPVAQFQNEPLCKTFHIKMSLIYVKMNLLAEQRLVLTEGKGNPEIACCSHSHFILGGGGVGGGGGGERERKF